MTQKELFPGHRWMFCRIAQTKPMDTEDGGLRVFHCDLILLPFCIAMDGLPGDIDESDSETDISSQRRQTLYLGWRMHLCQHSQSLEQMGLDNAKRLSWL